eukprot:6234631-Prorocentrum_lima.AAC.1
MHLRQPSRRPVATEWSRGGARSSSQGDRPKRADLESLTSSPTRSPHMEITSLTAWTASPRT